MGNIYLFKDLMLEAEILSTDDDFYKALTPLIDDIIAKKLTEAYDRAENDLKYSEDKIDRLLYKKINLMWSICKDRIKAMLIKEDIINLKSNNYLRTYDMRQTPIMLIEDRKQVLKDVKKLISLKDYLVAEYPIRKYKDFEIFSKEWKLMSCMRNSILSIYNNSVKNLSEKNISAVINDYLRMVMEINKCNDIKDKSDNIINTIFALSTCNRGITYVNRNLEKMLASNQSLFYSKDEKVRYTGLKLYAIKYPEYVKLKNGLEYLNETNGLGMKRRRNLLGCQE